MKDHFIVKNTAEEFVQAESQLHLIRYARWHHVRLPVVLVLGLILVASGIYALVTSGADAILVGVLLCGLGVFLVWSELSGRDIRRAVKNNKKNSADEADQAAAQSIFQFEFDGDVCRLFVDGAQRGGLDMKTIRTVQETDQVFVASSGDSTGFIIPKDGFVEGTPDEFRDYLRAHAKKYEFIRITERMQSFLK